MTVSPEHLDRFYEIARTFTPVPDNQDLLKNIRLDRRYTLEEVVGALDNPMFGYATGAALNNVQSPAESEVAESRPRVYTGPLYHQRYGTCAAWATIHAANAVGRKPSPELAMSLINTAIGDSLMGDNEGLSICHAAGILSDYPEDGLACKPQNGYDLEHLKYTAESGLRLYNPNALGEFVRDMIADGSALISVLNVRNSRYFQRQGIARNASHAVSIVGYGSADSGQMNVQMVDSNVGELAIPIDELATEFNNSTNHIFYTPLSVVSAA